MYPKVCLKNDMILRAGEIGTEFYMIKSGAVEVLAIDGTTVLSILEKGCFFGEISLLGLNDSKISVSIRAMKDCVFMCLNKEKFL